MNPPSKIDEQSLWTPNFVLENIYHDRFLFRMFVSDPLVESVLVSRAADTTVQQSLHYQSDTKTIRWVGGPFSVWPNKGHHKRFRCQVLQVRRTSSPLTISPTLKLSGDWCLLLYDPIRVTIRGFRCQVLQELRPSKSFTISLTPKQSCEWMHCTVWPNKSHNKSVSVPSAAGTTNPSLSVPL